MPEKIKDKSQLKIYGQYTQFNQKQINWTPIAESLFKSKFNAISIHLKSPWGNKDNFYPYPFENGKFNLLKDNEEWYDHFERFVRAMTANDITLELCFFDRYFLQNKTWTIKNLKHPFLQNNVGINWGQNEEPLYESWNKTGGTNPPDKAFAWVKWKTNGKDGFAERVVDYKFIGLIGEALERYIRRCIKILADVWREHPVWTDTYLIRVHNENYIMYRDGQHDDRGGETKIIEIVQMMFEEEGLKHVRDFRMIDDTLPLGLEDDEQIRELVRWQKFIDNMRWYSEIHGCTAEYIQKAVNAGMNPNTHIFSTDGMKPEKDPYFTAECKKITKLNKRMVDYKVPSDLTPYYDKDFHKTFDGVIGKMKTLVI